MSSQRPTPLAPDRVLGSAVIDLPQSFLLIALEVKEDRFIPRVETFGLESGVVRYQPNPALAHLIPDRVLAKVRAAEAAIRNGELKVVDREAGQMLP